LPGKSHSPTLRWPDGLVGITSLRAEDDPPIWPGESGGR